MADPAASDEPADPRLVYQQQAEAMARELMRTIELGPKLGWNEFDFGVDLFDPTLDDLEGLLAQGGRPDQQAVSIVVSAGLARHFTPEVRFRLMQELASRIGSEVRLDVREQVRQLLRAFHHLSIPGASIGLVLHLYPKHLFRRLKERHELYGAEERDFTASDHQAVDALQAGKKADLSALGDRVVAAAEKIIFSTGEADTMAAATIVALAPELAKRPGRRSARALSAMLWKAGDPAAAAIVRKALESMPVEAKDILDRHIVMHDPAPAARLALFAAMVDLKAAEVLPRLAEDALGHGIWSEKSKEPDHAKAVLAEILRLGDPRAVPMILYLMSLRPPAKALREAVVSTMKAGPWGELFSRGLAALEEGRPIVVPRGMSQEDFLQEHAQVRPKMDAEAASAEVRRVAKIWEECWHEELGWKTPREAIDAIGPRERELTARLSEESRKALGRMAGLPQVAALEAEFKAKWMTTPHNDISGRTPLAIILEERAARDPEGARETREAETVQLYDMALRAHESALDDDAKRVLKAVLQISPGHPFAKDFAERLERGEGIPGIDEGAEGPSTPRIILPS